MIKTELGKTTIRTLDYKKLMPSAPKEMLEHFEQVDMYADVSCILDAIEAKTSISTVIDIIEMYLEEKKEKLEND